MARRTNKQPKTFLGSVIELVVTVAIAVGLAILIQAFVVKPYRIPSGSMIPTLNIGQRVLANRLDTHPSSSSIRPTAPISAKVCAARPLRGRPISRRATRRPRPSPPRRSSSAWWGCRVTGSRSSTAT
jgi:hypothetical protein